MNENIKIKLQTDVLEGVLLSPPKWLLRVGFIFTLLFIVICSFSVCFIKVPMVLAKQANMAIMISTPNSIINSKNTYFIRTKLDFTLNDSHLLNKGTKVIVKFDKFLHQNTSGIKGVVTRISAVSDNNYDLMIRLTDDLGAIFETSLLDGREMTGKAEFVVNNVDLITFTKNKIICKSSR